MSNEEAAPLISPPGANRSSPAAVLSSRSGTGDSPALPVRGWRFHCLVDVSSEDVVVAYTSPRCCATPGETVNPTLVDGEAKLIHQERDIVVNDS